MNIDSRQVAHSDRDLLMRYLAERESIRRDVRLSLKRMADVERITSRVALAPTAQLAGVKPSAKRVLFVLAVNDTMNHKIEFDPDTVAPADVREAGGRELERWRTMKTKLDLARLWIAWAIEEGIVISAGVASCQSSAAFARISQTVA